jgi:hypothetical protein
MKETSQDDVLATLAGWPGIWTGEGVNHEKQTFKALLVARSLFKGTGTLLWFRAEGMDGTLYHEEVALLGGGIDQKMFMATANTNLPFLQTFSSSGRVSAEARLDLHHGDPSRLESFRETVTLHLQDNGRLLFAFAWAMPGETMQDRSSVMLTKTDKPAPAGCPLR